MAGGASGVEPVKSPPAMAHPNGTHHKLKGEQHCPILVIISYRAPQHFSCETLFDCIYFANVCDRIQCILYIADGIKEIAFMTL